MGAACSGSGDSAATLSPIAPPLSPSAPKLSQTVPPPSTGVCSVRSPLLVQEDLTDIMGRVDVVDLPPRRPWGVVGAHIDAQSTGWIYNQESYIAESPESASRVLHETYKEGGLPQAPFFGDESR